LALEIELDRATDEHSEQGRWFGGARTRAATSYDMASMGERKSAATQSRSGP